MFFVCQRQTLQLTNNLSTLKKKILWGAVPQYLSAKKSCFYCAGILKFSKDFFT